jgi:Zn-dependent alcohol dehydrogenase
MRARAAVMHEVKKPLSVEDVDVMEPGPHEVLMRWVAGSPTASATATCTS